MRLNGGSRGRGGRGGEGGGGGVIECARLVYLPLLELEQLLG